MTKTGKAIRRIKRDPLGNPVKNVILETRAELLARGFRNLEDASIKLGNSFSGLGDRIRVFSPEMAIQQALNNLNRITQNIQQAQKLGKPMAELEKQKGRIEIAENSLQASAAEVTLPIKTAMAKVSASILEFAASQAAWGAETATNLFKRLDQMFGDAVELWPILKGAFGDLKKMREQAEKDANKAKAGQSVANLQDFFSMKIPVPNAQPKLQGPHMAMPVFLIPQNK